ncbi:MAG: MOSC domain-containing protein [Actinobacteria bacterium]|nr:MOSC domain-containing protein [Actinomycetota bacterium]
MAHLEAVCTGRIRPTEHGALKRTAIDKRPVAGRVQVQLLGLAGDEIADLKHHGGADQAVYAFAREDYAFWETELGRPLAAGCFGENLTTVGADLQNARIGERWRVGETLLEVSGVRIPCAVFAGFVDEPHWVRRFTENGVPGAYFRVIEPGTVAAGDAIEVISVPDHDLTVELAFRAGTTEPELLPLLATEPRLSYRLRARADRYLARLS